MQLDEAIRGRRRVRAFQTTPVPRETILQVIRAGMWAPTACNRQLWKFLVVEKDVLSRELKHACEAVEAMSPPVVVFVLYDRRYNREHHANYQSAAAAIQNMLLTAHSPGLGSCWVAGYGDEQVIRQRLGIPGEYAIVAAVPLGYGTEENTVPPHRALEEVVCFNRFEGRPPPAALRPEAWTSRDLRDMVGYSSRAGSPDPRYYRPQPRGEFQGDLDFVPFLAGRTLLFGPFAGNHLFGLIRERKLEHVLTAAYAHAINLFLEEKRKRLGLEHHIGYGVWDGHLALETRSIDNVICIRELERHGQPDRVVAEFRRVLRPGGQLVLIYSNGLSPYYLFWRLRAVAASQNASLRGPFGPLCPWEVRRLLTGGFKPCVAKDRVFCPSRLSTVRGRPERSCSSPRAATCSGSAWRTKTIRPIARRGHGSAEAECAYAESPAPRR